MVPARRPSLRFLGGSFAPESLGLREFAARNRLGHQWIDVETLPDTARFLKELDLEPGDLPAVVAGEEVLRSATPGILSSYLGLTLDAIPERSFDVVVVGAGPAGVAGPRYAASGGPAARAGGSGGVG